MTDKTTIHIIVGTLALALLGIITGTLILTIQDKPTPELLETIATFVAGAISTFLVRTSVDPAQLEAAEPNVAETPTTRPFNAEDI